MTTDADKGGGLSYLDYMAGQALIGHVQIAEWLAKGGADPSDVTIAKYCYRIAQAMLAEKKAIEEHDAREERDD